MEKENKKTLILLIDTALTTCSVALIKNDKIDSFLEDDEKNSHSAKLTILIEEIFKRNDIDISELDAVAVSKGPGSYTGLRIGVSVAKGLCYALDIPLISVGTLESIACSVKDIAKEKKCLICPMIDARRMEVYTAMFDENMKLISEPQAIILDSSSFNRELKNSKIIFLGDGSEKFKKIIRENENAIFVENYKHSSKFMFEIALEKFYAKKFEDIAYFEPFYLKSFIPGKYQVKGLV